MKILAQRPTHISAVATVLSITKTFTVKYYDRKIQTNTASIVIIIIIIMIIIITTHIKRNSDCNGIGRKKKRKKKQTEMKHIRTALLYPLVSA